jgi:hypothetical protein
MDLRDSKSTLKTNVCMLLHQGSGPPAPRHGEKSCNRSKRISQKIGLSLQRLAQSSSVEFNQAGQRGICLDRRGGNDQARSAVR